MQLATEKVTHMHSVPWIKYSRNIPRLFRSDVYSSNRSQVSVIA